LLATAGSLAGCPPSLKSESIYLMQKQYDALISFTFNLGGTMWEKGGSRAQTMCAYLAGRQYTEKETRTTFELYDNGGNLLGRRRDEARIFTDGKYRMHK
jgi:GH24 family phage-related lysozyme (muramidase)